MKPLCAEWASKADTDTQQASQHQHVQRDRDQGSALTDLDGLVDNEIEEDHHKTPGDYSGQSCHTPPRTPCLLHNYLHDGCDPCQAKASVLPNPKCDFPNQARKELILQVNFMPSEMAWCIRGIPIYLTITR